jgi:hypothetical protein
MGASIHKAAGTIKMPPNPDELAALRAFRAAALQVRRSSVIASGATVQIQASARDEGTGMTFRLLAEEPCRSLAIAIRLVYMQGERSNYFRVCNILYRHSDATVRKLVADCRTRYQSVLDGKYVQFNLHRQFEGRVAGPRDVFEAWLYGLVFHQDEEHQAIAEELAKYMGGGAFPFTVNLVALQLAGAVLDLDDVIADFLGEARVPRIEPEPENWPAA